MSSSAFGIAVQESQPQAPTILALLFSAQAAFSAKAPQGSCERKIARDPDERINHRRYQHQKFNYRQNYRRHAFDVHPVALWRAPLHPQEGQPRRGHQVRPPCSLLARRQVLQVRLGQSISACDGKENHGLTILCRQRVTLKKRYGLLLTQMLGKNFQNQSLFPLGASY